MNRGGWTNESFVVVKLLQPECILSEPEELQKL